LKELYEIMISSGALKIDTTEYFTFSSGIRSPIYCDTRKLISFPEYRNRIITALLERIKDIGAIDSIASVATGGISWGAWLSDRMNVPFCYVRSEKKSHGTKNIVEGVLNTSSNILLVEDVVTTGKSLGLAASQIREIGGENISSICLFSYGFRESIELLSGLKINLYPLMDLKNLINQIGDESQKAEIEKWSKNPWENKHEN
jgi:orotate phosphoribosyltransferase